VSAKDVKLARCALCGHEFDETESAPACAACAIGKGGCGLIRCPSCGYEWPREPEWVSRLFFWKKGKKPNEA